MNCSLWGIMPSTVEQKKMKPEEVQQYIAHRVKELLLHDAFCDVRKEDVRFRFTFAQIHAKLTSGYN